VLLSLQGPLAETLPPIAYRFFLVESESEPDLATNNGKDASGSTKSSSWLTSFGGSSSSSKTAAGPMKDTVAVPKAAAGNGPKDNSRIAPTAVTFVQMFSTVCSLSLLFACYIFLILFEACSCCLLQRISFYSFFFSPPCCQLGAKLGDGVDGETHRVSVLALSRPGLFEPSPYPAPTH
jgi:hypothetical protein